MITGYTISANQGIVESSMSGSSGRAKLSENNGYAEMTKTFTVTAAWSTGEAGGNHGADATATFDVYVPAAPVSVPTVSWATTGNNFNSGFASSWNTTYAAYTTLTITSGYTYVWTGSSATNGVSTSISDTKLYANSVLNLSSNTTSTVSGNYTWTHTETGTEGNASIGENVINIGAFHGNSHTYACTASPAGHSNYNGAEVVHTISATNMTYGGISVHWLTDHVEVISVTYPSGDGLYNGIDTSTSEDFDWSGGAKTAADSVNITISSNNQLGGSFNATVTLKQYVSGYGWSSTKTSTVNISCS